MPPEPRSKERRPRPAAFKLIPGTDIDEIRAAHPDWSEDQCRHRQSNVVMEAFLKTQKHKRPPQP